MSAQLKQKVWCWTNPTQDWRVQCQHQTEKKRKLKKIKNKVKMCYRQL